MIIGALLNSCHQISNNDPQLSKLLLFCCRLHKNAKAASEVDYPAYGVTGPAKERVGPGPGDRKLAQSAQMYHYQHQKQQMIAMEKWVVTKA